jgi:hypothetical protein
MHDRTPLHEQQGALAGFYECHYFCRGDYRAVRRKVGQLVHCVGKGEYAVGASLLGLSKDAAVKGSNRDVADKRDSSSILAMG